MEKNLDLGFEFVMVAEVNDVVAAVDQRSSLTLAQPARIRAPSGPKCKVDPSPGLRHHRTARCDLGY
jgi:hypothetical protein